MEENKALAAAEAELKTQELTAKEKQAKVDELMKKFPERGHQWIHSHTRGVNDQQVLTQPLPVVINKSGEPEWLNRKARRMVMKKIR